MRTAIIVSRLTIRVRALVSTLVFFAVVYLFQPIFVVSRCFFSRISCSSKKRFQILYGNPYNGTVQPNIVVEIAENGSGYFLLLIFDMLRNVFRTLNFIVYDVCEKGKHNFF